EDLPSTLHASVKTKASSQSLFVKSFGQSIFGSSPSDPDFEYLGLEVKEDILCKIRCVLSLSLESYKDRNNQNTLKPRQIKFLDDGRGSSKPSDLYAPKGLS
ncbi:hypothetical protein HAX54_043006, partial [Datura stramonium]|nr:hypothetical protein [Datura stramonium]